MNILLASVTFSRPHIPISFARAMRKTIPMESYVGYWKTGLTNTEKSYVRRHMDFDFKKSSYAYVYFVHHVPLAIVAANDFTVKGTPIISDIIMNKGGIILMDCANHMRKSFFELKQNKHVSMKTYGALFSLPINK